MFSCGATSGYSSGYETSRYITGCSDSSGSNSGLSSAIDTLYAFSEMSGDGEFGVSKGFLPNTGTVLEGGSVTHL